MLHPGGASLFPCNPASEKSTAAAAVAVALSVAAVAAVAVAVAVVEVEADADADTGVSIGVSIGAQGSEQGGEEEEEEEEEGRQAGRQASRETVVIAASGQGEQGRRGAVPGCQRMRKHGHSTRLICCGHLKRETGGGEGEPT